MTLQEVRELRDTCGKLRLEGAEKLQSYSDAGLAAICNGIGPESFPAAARLAADKLLPSIRPAAMIHDVEYHEGGSFAEFHAANERLRRNGKICARNLYPWWRFLRRIAAIRAADECANLCHAFGWIAWRKDSAAPEENRGGSMDKLVSTKKIRRTLRCLMSAALFALATIQSSCTGLESKAVGIGSGVDAIKLDTAGSISAGTLMPNLILGGAVSSIAAAPLVNPGEKTSQIVIVWVRRKSVFASMLGLDASTEAFSYIGAPGESAGETSIRLKALEKILDVCVTLH